MPKISHEEASLRLERLYDMTLQMSRFISDETGLSDWSDGVKSAIKIMIENIKNEVEFLERYGKQELT